MNQKKKLAELDLNNSKKSKSRIPARGDDFRDVKRPRLRLRDGPQRRLSLASGHGARSFDLPSHRRLPMALNVELSDESNIERARDIVEDLFARSPTRFAMICSVGKVFVKGEVRANAEVQTNLDFEAAGAA
jgi:hypothetical protein